MSAFFAFLLGLNQQTCRVDVFHSSRHVLYDQQKFLVPEKQRDRVTANVAQLSVCARSMYKVRSYKPVYCKTPTASAPFGSTLVITSTVIFANEQSSQRVPTIFEVVKSCCFTSSDQCRSEMPTGDVPKLPTQHAGLY